MSTHNPVMAKRAVESGIVEMLMFSINPAFNLLPPTDNIDNYFTDEYQVDLGGIDPQRAELYKLCEQNDVGLTVMKPYAGGRLFDVGRSPFGVALTPVQCIYYCLASMQPEEPAAVRAHYEALEHHADECTGCKGCESRCPFGVSVADRMARTAELFRQKSR